MPYSQQTWCPNRASQFLGGATVQDSEGRTEATSSRSPCPLLRDLLADLRSFASGLHWGMERNVTFHVFWGFCFFFW